MAAPQRDTASKFGFETKVFDARCVEGVDTGLAALLDWSAQALKAGRVRVEAEPEDRERARPHDSAALPLRADVLVE